MISEKIAKLLNEQIAHEQYAAQYYLSMSAWFSGKDLDGIANYFRVQSKEELMHSWGPSIFLKEHWNTKEK